MNVIILSDVHLEFYKDQEHPVDLYTDHKCDTLIIAGDFGIPIDVYGKPNEVFINHLKKLRSMYKYIVYVPGNHEYYKCLNLFMTTTDLDGIMYEICESLDIHFLQKSCWIHPETNVTFAGCTLWSQIDYVGKSKSNDFMRIFQNVNEYLLLFEDHSNWLEETLKNQNNTQMIVVTHHLPSFKMVSDMYKHENNTGYASDLDYLFQKPLIGWICGHSHEAKIAHINDIPIILNPTGYPNEKQVSKRLNQVFTI